MTQPFIPYSSAYVCDQIAGRDMERMTQSSIEAIRKIADRFNPTFDRLMRGSKIKRGALRATIESIADKVSDEASVVLAILHNYGVSKLSTNEEYSLQFLSMVSDDHGSLDVIACDFMINRRVAQIDLTSPDLFFHRHALSRYMQREQQPLETLYKQLLPALRSAIPLAIAAAVLPGEREIALPLGSGLLLGKFNVVDSKTHPSHRTTIVYDRKGGRGEDEPYPSWFGYRFQVRAMTYVDAEAFHPHQERLHRRLTEWEATYREELALLLELVAFPFGPRSDEFLNVQDRTRTMLDAAMALIKSPDWKFVHRQKVA